MASDQVQPTTIDAITGAVSKAYALLAGLQLDLFTALRDGPLTARELAPVVGGEPRRLAALLSYLVAAGLLTVSDGRFANTPEADRYLVRGRPGSRTDSTVMTSQIWSAYARTAESIRASHALANHDYATMAPEEVENVYRFIDRDARASGTWLADAFDFATCRTLLDAAGGSGGLAVSLTERYPLLRATVADLPSAVPVTERFLREAGAHERVRALGVDLLEQPPAGTYDAAVLAKCLRLFDPEDARRVVRHVGAAVRPGGTLYVLEVGLEDTRLGPESGLWFDFLSISFYEHGHAHTESEYRAWLEQAGFGEVEVRWGPPGPDLAVIGRKLG